MPLLTLEGASKLYADRWQALYPTDFSLEPGEFAFLVGASGSGKSTLLKLLYFEEPPTEGQVEVLGFSSARVGRGTVPNLRRRIGMVFQDFRLLRDRNAADNVAFALHATGTGYRVAKRRAQELLVQVGLLPKKDLYPFQLSGGEQQRVALARALSMHPQLILADEPTGNLDPRTTEEIMQLLVDANQQGAAILMATHNFDLVDRYPYRVAELEGGRLKEARAPRKGRS